MESFIDKTWRYIHIGMRKNLDVTIKAEADLLKCSKTFLIRNRMKKYFFDKYGIDPEDRAYSVAELQELHAKKFGNRKK